MQSLAPGSCIAGRFVIDSLAGQGGMGLIFHARDLLTDCEVALKILSPGSAPSLLTARFDRECQVLAMLRHPAIVSYIAHGEVQPGQPYLVMEWLEGESLAQRISRQPLGLSELGSLAERIARALAVAHQHGIVHRDIKPSKGTTERGAPDIVPNEPRSACHPTRRDAERCFGFFRVEGGHIEVRIRSQLRTGWDSRSVRAGSGAVYGTGQSGCTERFNRQFPVGAHAINPAARGTRTALRARADPEHPLLLTG